MSTSVAPTLPTLPPLALPPVRPLRFPTLVSVELRKMTDTRSGRWLLATMGTLIVGILTWKLTHSSIETSSDSYLGGTMVVVGYLAPILGLLAMTSEWTQRTALTTFTLAPRRMPVLAAKALAALVLSLSVMAIGVVVSLGATALGGALHGPASFADLGMELRAMTTLVVLQVLMGVAFGALAAQTTVALGAYLIAPTAFAAFSTVLGSTAPWFDVFTAYDQLASDQPFAHLGQTTTAVALWVALPCALGLLRSLRREVK